jgi:hypothetical protein
MRSFPEITPASKPPEAFCTSFNPATPSFSTGKSAYPQATPGRNILPIERRYPASTNAILSTSARESGVIHHIS